MATNNAINLPENGFFAYLNTTVSNVTGDGTMYTVLFDTLQAGAGYNTGTGAWTVPATGKYLIGSSVGAAGLEAGHSQFNYFYYVNGTGSSFCNFNGGNARNAANELTAGGFSTVLYLTVGDSVTYKLYVHGGTKAVDLIGYMAGANAKLTYFCASQIL